ncbi:hypothetical protein C7M84_011829 [Penaeus vannamei]|uniref:Uncharacterized protein n=1 Tax=Penaeus vannamei TaxID=6689 RepID=A0A423UBJ1_PENVA|nr:hypothetical protein C7M84_011829 [Penaeus vannamei]
MPQSAEVIRKKIKAELNLQLLNCPIISGKWARRGTKTRAKAQRHGHLAGSVSEASLRSGGVRSGSWRARLVVRSVRVFPPTRLFPASFFVRVTDRRLRGIMRQPVECVPRGF